MRLRYLRVAALLVILNSQLAYPQNMQGGVIEKPLSNAIGDPLRGRGIVTSRQTGLCLLCHSGPFPEAYFQGNLAPDLGVSASHLSAAQLRARLVDASYFNPSTIMPSYYRVDGLKRVAPKFAGQSLLSAQEIEDVVAFLATMSTQQVIER